jgi:KamA family protein
MLSVDEFSKLSAALREYGRGSSEVLTIVSEIRAKLNPHPAGQLCNVPTLNGTLLKGMQHKYAQTVLFFPAQGQICHSFCTFCFRWPQFVMDDIKFAANSPQDLIGYLRRHPEVIDVLMTGGDPMVMGARILASYLEPLLVADIPNLSEIRIGTKSLSYWPYRFLEDRDSDEVLALFERVVKRGIHLSIMAHVNHWREMTEPFKQAVKRIQGTGAVVRTQAPIMHHINDDANVWSKMWSQQVKIGMVPFYMFIPRDTGSRHYFEVPLAKAYSIFQQAYQQQSGLGRTVRGPVMSTDPGKVEIVGVTEINNQKVFVLRFLQARKSDLVLQPFFAKFDEAAVWLNDLKPAQGNHFPFEKTDSIIEEGELEKIAI